MHVPAAIEPAVACLCYALCSTSLSLFNKLAFSGQSFDFPMAILAFQSACAVVFLKGGDVLGLTQPVPLSRDLLVIIAPVTLLFCLMLWTSGKALRHCSMPLFTVCKNLAVVGTTAWEYYRFKAEVTRGVAFSLALMVGGSVVAGSGDLSTSAVGIMWMLLNVATTVAYLAVLKERVPADIPSAAKTFHNNVLTLALFCGAAAATGEGAAFLARLSEQTAVFKAGLVCTGVLGTLINVCTFWCMRVASGGTYAFVGATNKIPVALIGHFAFHSVLSPSGWVGVVCGLGAGLVFAYSKSVQKQAPKYDKVPQSGANFDAGDVEAEEDEEDGRAHARTLKPFAPGR